MWSGKKWWCPLAVWEIGSAGRHIQPGVVTRRQHAERSDAHAQAIRCGPYCTFFKVGVPKPDSVFEDQFECKMTREAGKTAKGTFIHASTSKGEHIRPFVLHCLSGCIETEIPTRRYRPIALVQ